MFEEIWDILQNSGITTQKHNIKISTNYEHTEVVETELGLVTNNPISYYGLVTRDPDRRWEA